MCGSDPRLPLPDPPSPALLAEALRKCSPAETPGSTAADSCPPRFTQLVLAACARPTWVETLASLDLTPFRGCTYSDSLLAVAACWLTWAGRGDEAGALLRTRTSAFDSPNDEEAAIRSSQDGRYFSLARVEGSLDWELQMLAPAGGTADESGELENHVLLRLPESGPCEATPGCPRLVPPDWTSFRQCIALENQTVQAILAAMQSPAPSAPSGLARFFKETWGRFQSQLVETLEGLTPTDAALSFRQACETRERRWFRGLAVDSWREEASASLVAPFREQADSLRLKAEDCLCCEIRAFLEAELAARGVDGLASLAGDLGSLVNPAQTEIRKSRNQGERLASRMGDAVVETTRAIQKAAGSLSWAFQKPPFAEALEQFEDWRERLLDHQMACQVEGFLDTLSHRLETEIATVLSSLREKECRLQSLARGTHRVVAEAAAVEGSDVAASLAPSLGAAERSGWLDRLEDMPPDNAEATWEWLQAACEASPHSRTGDRPAYRRSPG